MIKSYTTKFLLRDTTKAGRLMRSEPLNMKLNEGLDAIQEHGGTIINASFVAAGESSVFIYFIVYEDNGKFEEINSYLRDVVFNFSEIKMDDLCKSS